MSETFDYLLPDLGEGIAEAEVISWSVDVNGKVQAHEPLLVVETDKAQVELPSPVDGVLTARGAEEGSVVKVGTLVASFTVDAAVAADAAADPDPVAEPVPVSAPVSDNGTTPVPVPTGRRALAAPTVRKLATELGIDLATITGTGPGGRVVKADVLHAAENGSAPEPVTSETVPESAPARRGDDVEIVAIRGTRRAIARKMTVVAQTVPMVSGHQEVDVTDLRAMLTRLRPKAEAAGVRLTWTSFFALATVQALGRFPEINAHLDMDREELSVHRRINLGMAANIDGGLVVPVIGDASRLSLLDLAAEIDRLGAAARARTLTRAELTGATFTLTNYGAVGGWFGTMMVNTPEVGILGFGKVVDKPLVVDGAVAIRTVVPLSSTFDHRVVDGAVGALFTGAIAESLEQPDLLLLGARHGDG